MKRKLLKICMVLAFSTLLFSCKEEPAVEPSTNNYIKIAETFSANSSFKIEMFTSDSLFVGYNKMFFKLTDNTTNQPISVASIEMHPLMDMGTFSHACPFENPGTNASSEGYFEGAIIFSMPGTDTWTVDADITANGKTETSRFTLSKVVSKTLAAKIVLIDSLETSPGTIKITKYPISIVPPKDWKVGNNVFEITIHKMESMMSFPPVTDLTVEITPEMPSMGHGSPNNVNPVHRENGHYIGSVNFTMTGDWRIHLTIKQGERLISEKLFFDITF